MKIWRLSIFHLSLSLSETACDRKNLLLLGIAHIWLETEWIMSQKWPLQFQHVHPLLSVQVKWEKEEKDCRWFWWWSSCWSYSFQPLHSQIAHWQVYPIKFKEEVPISNYNFIILVWSAKEVFCSLYREV